MATTERSKTRIKGFRSAELDFQLIRTMGKADAGASIGECLAVVERMKNEDPGDWIEEFARMARHVEADGDARMKKGHIVSARDQFLKASEYYRAAEYYGDPRTSSRQEHARGVVDCFHKYMQTLDVPGEFIQIPFEGNYIPACFFSPSRGQGKRKTLLCISGFDGTSEETYMNIGRYALERGYNVMVFDGPGQVGMLRRHPGVTFRPDYEVPVSAVIDHALSRPDVDQERLGLLGLSYGGYFVSRAASYDSRIKALVPDSPIVDLYRYHAGFFGGPENLEAMLREDELRLDALDTIPAELLSAEYRWAVINFCIRFGRPSFKEVVEYMKEFKITDDLLRNIKCPCLTLVGEGEGAEPREQARLFSTTVSGPATSYAFTVDEGADSHCQAGNVRFAAAVIFDWMDEVFS